MQSDLPPKRFLSIRVTESELKEIYLQCERSACRSLTEYAKKILTKKPVTVRVRNESQDDLLRALTGIRKRLDQLAEQSKEREDRLSLRQIIEIRSLIRRAFEKYSR